MVVQAKVKNVKPTTNHLKVIIPDDKGMKSTHECEINWPDVPIYAKMAHIIPQLAHQSLLSMVKLCTAGCTVIFKMNFVKFFIETS